MRDALSLMACDIRGDDNGAAVILDGSEDLRELAMALAALAAGALRNIAGPAATDDELCGLLGKHLLRIANR